MRFSLVPGLALILIACPVVEVHFATDPSIMRGAWTGTITPYCQTRLSSISWSPDGLRLATFGENLRLWNANDGTLEQTMAVKADYPDRLGWNADGTRLALVRPAGSNGAYFEVYDPATGSLVSAQNVTLGYPQRVAFSRGLNRLALVIPTPPGPPGALQPQLTPLPPEQTLVFWNLQSQEFELRSSTPSHKDIVPTQVATTPVSTTS